MTRVEVTGLHGVAAEVVAATDRRMWRHEHANSGTHGLKPALDGSGENLLNAYRLDNMD